MLCSIAVALYAWGVWCGVKVLENQAGWEGSTISYWAVQIPTFGSPVIAYFFTSGFHLTTTLQFSPLKFDINFLLGSTFNYSLMNEVQPLLIGVNLFALGVVVWLMRLRKAHA